jgi:hypothetical protein
MDRVVRGIVVGVSVVVAAACFLVFVKQAFLHVHPPGENPHAHEWDLPAFGLLLGLGGLFTGIALSALFRWRWWVRLGVVVLAPFATIGACMAIFWLASFLRP